MNEPNSHRHSKITKEKLMEMISSQLIKFMEQHSILTQASLSDTSGVPKGTLSKAIKNSEGNTPLSIQNAFRIAETYGLTLDYIYGRSDVESYQEGVIIALEKCLFPSVHDKEFHGNAYSIPTITLSSFFAAYFEAVWAAHSSSLSSQAIQLCLQQAKDDLLSDMERGAEGEPVEYALIPLTALNNQTIMGDLDFSPVRHKI